MHGFGVSVRTWTVGIRMVGQRILVVGLRIRMIGQSIRMDIEHVSAVRLYLVMEKAASTESIPVNCLRIRSIRKEEEQAKDDVDETGDT